MDGDYEARAPNTPLGRDVAVDAAGLWIGVVEHESLAPLRRHKAITGSNIDALPSRDFDHGVLTCQ